MNIFKNAQSVETKYIIDTDLIEFPHIPKGIYQDIKKYPSAKKVGCPAISSVDNQLYYAFSPISIEVEFGLDDNNDPYYRYLYDHKTVQDNEYVKQWLEKTLVVQQTKDKIDFQMILPYAFITDHKDLYLQTLPPPNVTHENCHYVTGGLNPYNWIRNLNSAWCVIDNSKPARIRFDVNKPVIMYHFSKPIKLGLIEKNKNINDYLEQHRFISTYRLHQRKLITGILKRRPKNLI